MWKKIVVFCLICLVFFCSCDMDDKKKENSKNEAFDDKQMQKAKTTPFEKYPTQVKYKLGKLATKDNSNMPKGESYENNAYTKYLKNMLNIQNEDVFEAGDTEYEAYVEKALSSGELPDVMLVSDMEQLKYLVQKDMIEDMTSSYNNCMSDKIKEIYNSYGNEILDAVTFNNKIMAIPETNIEDGPNLLWLRKDWLDEMKLTPPTNLEQAEEIIAKFAERQKGNVGLVCSADMVGDAGYSYEYQLDNIFACYNAFPKQWISVNGNVVYGSIQSEVKDALGHLRDMYKKKILDNYFLMRNSDQIIKLIETGKCGAFFGPWWAPNNPLMSAREKDTKMDWQPYLIPTNSKGEVKYHSHMPTSKYVVVKKGYEHPEVVCKELSVMYDYLRYQEKDVKEFDKYYQDNVDPTVRPISINVDYCDALSKCYTSISNALRDEASVSSLGIIENAYYKSCKDYLKSPTSANGKQWAAYTSRIVTIRELNNAKLVKEPSLYFGETSSMSSKWFKLKELEKQAFYKIITSEEDLNYFDTFVKEWKKNGGDDIQKEVSVEVSKKKR